MEPANSCVAVAAVSVSYMFECETRKWRKPGNILVAELPVAGQHTQSGKPILDKSLYFHNYRHRATHQDVSLDAASWSYVAGVCDHHMLGRAPCRGEQEQQPRHNTAARHVLLSDGDALVLSHLHLIISERGDRKSKNGLIKKTESC